MALRFTVYGVPQSKGSMRAVQIKGMKFPIVTESNRSAKSWGQLVAQGASLALQQQPADERHVLVSGVRCAIVFFLPRPKKYRAAKYRGVVVAHINKPDVDKLTRSVLDALTGVVWADDACVVDLVALKRYADEGAPPRVDVCVERSHDAQLLGLFTPEPRLDGPFDLSLDLQNPQEG